MPPAGLPPPASARGFTLVEVIIVILILSIAAGFLLPRLQTSAHVELLSHSRRLALTLRHVRQQAILSGRTFRLYYDLGQHRYWVESADESTLEQQFAPAEGKLGQGIPLPEEIAFTDVILPLGGGRIVEGVAFTDFYPDGTMDMTIVHLDNGDEFYTILNEPLSGAVYLSVGYVTPPDLEV